MFSLPRTGLTASRCLTQHLYGGYYFRSLTTLTQLILVENKQNVTRLRTFGTTDTHIGKKEAMEKFTMKATDKASQSSFLNREKQPETNNWNKTLLVMPAIFYYFNPLGIVKFMFSYVADYRFYFIFMARACFQAVRPLLAFSVFGEIMKLVLASISCGTFAFLFSFVLAFEVLYFFLQCFISYVFLTMFFTCM